jgi:hypothetical protein
MDAYIHFFTFSDSGWRQHGIEIEGAGTVFITVPHRTGSEEDGFTEAFLTQALAARTGRAADPIECRYVAIAAGPGQRQHFVCDEHNRPLLRTLYIAAGTDRDRHTEKFLQEAVAALNG